MQLVLVIAMKKNSTSISFETVTSIWKRKTKRHAIS